MAVSRQSRASEYGSDLAMNIDETVTLGVRRSGARSYEEYAAGARRSDATHARAESNRRRTDKDISSYSQSMRMAEESITQEDSLVEAEPERAVHAAARKAKRGGRWATPVILLSLAVIAVVFFWANQQIDSYGRFQEMRSLVSRNTFYDGISVDGVNLGGLAFEQALSLFEERDARENESFYVDLFAGEAQWRISSEQVELHRNTDTVLRQAYAKGRTGSLEERYSAVSALSSKGIDLSTSMWYDKTTVRNLVDNVVSRLTVEARDAGVRTFDFVTRLFTFDDEQPGQRVDADALYAEVARALDAKSADSTRVIAPIEINVIHVSPTVTRDKVPWMYGKISSFTTKTTSDRNRNTNIQLATAAINGSVLQPDEVISFNEKTGQRTPAKGYKDAGAIKNGALVDEPGGGVCQVSTTLFNALVRSNLSIVMRNPHAWPVSYVHRGEDAMVNWPDQDLKMRNTTGSPIYIIGSYSNQTLTFEVYGLLLGDNKVIELESVTTKTTNPGEPVYTRNTGLAAGTSITKIQARTGYEVTTYRVVYEGGREISRDVFYNSRYRAYTKQVEYN